MSLRSKTKGMIRLLKDSDFRFAFLARRGFEKHVNSEEFVKRLYKYKMGFELNLENPVRYTEKLQWLKLYDCNPMYTSMVDKYEAKRIVAEKIGEEYVVPLLGVWSNVNEIDFQALPDRFVLKTTHDSGGIVICKDKNKLNIPLTKMKLNYYLKRNYYECSREWPYKNVQPRIIAEEYMEDSKYKELRDYKFFTFHGEPKVLYIAKGRGTKSTVADFFDMDFNHLPFTIDHDMADEYPEKPVQFEKMKEFAQKLSRGTPQLRVDFYEVDSRIYVGEMTFFHCSGMDAFHPDEWDFKFGEWVSLPSAEGMK